MNVRERAKNYEAFMSSVSTSSGREKSRSQEELSEKQGPAVGNTRKISEEENNKQPVPPPRKVKKQVPGRPGSPQVNHKGSVPGKESPEVQAKNTSTKTQSSTENEKPKASRRPPPRPAPCKQPSSPSLLSKVPQPKARNVFQKHPISKDAPKTSSVVAQKTPTMLPRKTLSQTPPMDSKKTPSVQIQKTPLMDLKNIPFVDTQKTPSVQAPKTPPVDLKKTPSIDTHETSSVHTSMTPANSSPKLSKDHPKRPPPPLRVSSLPRKQKPPVPPKPKRPHRSMLAAQTDRKSATLPMKSTQKNEEEKPCSTEKNTDVLNGKSRKVRSLTDPHRIGLETESITKQGEEKLLENGAMEENSKPDKSTSQHEEQISDVSVQEPKEESMKDLANDETTSDSAVHEKDSTLNNEVPCDIEKHPETGLKREVLGITDEQMEIERKNIEYENSFNTDFIEYENENIIEDTNGQRNGLKTEKMPNEKQNLEDPNSMIVDDDTSGDIDVSGVCSGTQEASVVLDSRLEEEKQIDSTTDGKQTEVTDEEKVGNIPDINGSSSACKDVDNSSIVLELDETNASASQEEATVVDNEGETDVKEGDNDSVVSLVKDENTCDDVPASNIEPALQDQTANEDSSEVAQETCPDDIPAVSLKEKPSDEIVADMDNFVEESLPSSIEPVQEEPEKQDEEEIQQPTDGVFLETSLDEEFFEDSGQGEDTGMEEKAVHELQEEVEEGTAFSIEGGEKKIEEEKLEKEEMDEQLFYHSETVVTDQEFSSQPEAETQETTSCQSNEATIDDDEVQGETLNDIEVSSVMQENTEVEESSELTESEFHDKTEDTVSSVTEEKEEDEAMKSLSPTPVRPSRTKRPKNKPKNTYENTKIISEIEQQEDVTVESENIESVEDERPHSPNTHSGVSYENIVLPNTDISSAETEEQEVADETESKKNEDDYLVEDPEFVQQHENTTQRPRYENVVLPARNVEENQASIYEVPRRRSFHSQRSIETKVRKVRSFSFGSLERDARVHDKICEPRVAAGLEDIYVAPRSIAVPSSSVAPEDMYVSPRSIRTSSESMSVSESEYHVPQSLVREDKTVAYSASAEEDTYVVPRSLRASSPITESEYHVPQSRTREEPGEAEYKVPQGVGVQHTYPEEENVYSVPVTSSDEPLSQEGSMNRSCRSRVISSREQLPKSLKSAPTKPPRSNLGREDSDDLTKPLPISDELTTPSPLINQSSSPKPRRPAPPRPKAPTSGMIDSKEKTSQSEDNDVNEGAKKLPPRPPPPLNRISVASSEPGPIASPLSDFPIESSESDSDEEPKSPVPTGPPKKKTHHIAHEILSTEKTFVNALTLCCEDCYALIAEAEVIPESTLNDIFKDLGNIHQLDSEFYQEMVERMKTWDEHERIGDIVKKYGHFLKMYTTYINHYDKAMTVLQETSKENLQFAELVQQFQASEKCKGLSLVAFMLKPVQRIPSYRLLLKDYLKHLTPDSDEYQDIKVALGTVSKVATHINDSMKKVDNFERVLRIQASIVGNAEIVKPGREFIKDGLLQKLCRKDMQERMFFLLTDVLLYTTPVGGGQYKLKETLPLLAIKVRLPESPDFENEFSIISKMRSFTLSASTLAERDEWIEQLDNAISAVTKKKSTFHKSKDGTIVEPDVEEESKLGEKAPVWIPDTRVTMCMLCTDGFTVTNRRHHCRGCGKVVCGSCSDNLAPLAYLDYSQARVCEVCYVVLLKEQNKSIPTNEPVPPQSSPIGISGEDLESIHRKPPKFEILHRFKPGTKKSNRKSKLFRPSVCTEVVGHESGSQMSGYLRFKRTNKHGWKRLWFVLKDKVLYTYKASEDVVAIETIPILGYAMQEATRTEGDEIQFQLKHAGLPPIVFKVESESSAFRWIQELKKATTL